MMSNLYPNDEFTQWLELFETLAEFDPNVLRLVAQN